MRIYCLHGSLGHFSDWDFLKNSPLSKKFEIHSIDLYKNSNLNFFDWAINFNEFINSEKCEAILLGYSLGARLALHSLIHHPSNFIKSAILVSTHAGLPNEEEKLKRLENDALWKSKLHELPWPEFWQEWNQQSVFEGSPKILNRTEISAPVKKLEYIFDQWSLGRQENLGPYLKEIKIKSLWMYGELDIKFKNLATKTSENSPLISVVPVAKAAHRCPWENPEDFIQKILSFL